MSLISGFVRSAVLPSVGLFVAVFFGICLIEVTAQEMHRDEAADVAATSMVWPIFRATEIDANFHVQVTRCFLPVAATYGYDLRITSGFRSWEEQEAVYRQGRSEHGHVVTDAPPGFSLHNYGLAVDVVDREHGYRINWERLGRIAAFCGIEQNEEGDQAHFMHRAGLSIWELMEGKRPSTLVLPCSLLVERFDAGQSLTRDDLRTCGADKI